MRRTITSESLGQETRYTRAYLTAVDLFRDRLTTRIYLRDTLKHSKQKESLSCEANSISNLFNYYRDKTKSPRISETEVFRIMPKDEKLPESIDTDSGAVRIWGDPDTHFVGRVEGKQSSNPNKLTGYGIHPK